MCSRTVLEAGWLTAVNTKMLLQVMFVFEGFSTFAAFELAVSSSFVQLRRLQTEKQTESYHVMEDEWESLSREGSRLRDCGTEADGGI